MVAVLGFRYDLGITWGLLEKAGGRAIGLEESARIVGGRGRR